MVKAIFVVLLLAQAGCSSVPYRQQDTPSPCATSEASYECQVERYHNINTQ